MRAELTYAQTAPPLEPIDDDQTTRNDITVSRPGGTSVHLVDETGPLSVQAPEDGGVGRYDESLSLNAADDTQLPSLAGWRLHLGTWDEARWPSLTLDLAKDPDLVDTVCALESGDRITVTEMPDFLPPDDIDAVVQGYTETLGTREWTWTANTTPYGPYRVVQLPDALGNGDELARLDTTGSTLLTDTTTTATAVTVLTTQTPEERALWITSVGPYADDPGDFPFAVRFGGEVATVTAAAPAAYDTFTRTVSGGWGILDSGQSWTIAGGSASDFSVDGSAGKHALTTRNLSRWSTLPGFSETFDLVVAVTTSAAPTGDSIYAHLAARMVDSNNCYLARVEFAPGAGVVLSIIRRVDSGGVAVETALGTFPTGMAATPGNSIMVRFAGAGSTLRAKAWHVEDDEHDWWDLIVTDTTFTAAGLVGVRSILDNANTNTLPVTVAYDNFAVLNPQTFTLARAANGISKSHLAGTDVRLAHPTVIAL